MQVKLPIIKRIINSLNIKTYSFGIHYKKISHRLSILLVKILKKSLLLKELNRIKANVRLL